MRQRLTMNRRLLLFICLFSGFVATAQKAIITGIIKDSATGLPLTASSVSWINKAETKTTSTDSTGYFSIRETSAGNYNLKFSRVGYKLKSISVSIKEGQSEFSVGTILLAADDSKLQTVTVTANTPLVEDKGDRLVYNASADISNTGGTAADVLRKVPTLTVDLEGNVQMRGNGNIKVLVNGKPSAMMARNLADALRQMPASVIKSVEVITSPGAKYDAEGAAGIINIITKKGLRGFNGSINATAGDRNQSLGTSLSVKTSKIGLNFKATGYQNRFQREFATTRTNLVGGMPASILYQTSEADNTGIGGYGELAFDYDPDSLNHLNFSANVWGGNFPNGSTTNIRLTDPAGTELQAFRNESRFKNPYGNGQLDLGWTRTFKKPEQEFSLLGQFSRMPDNYFYNTDRIAPDEEVIYREKSTNYSRNKEYTFQADYTQPISIRSATDTSTLKLEIGTKAIIRDIGSEVRVEQSLNGKDELVPDPSQNNDFDYTQRVISGYTSLRWSNKAKWSVNAGARLEHTEIKGSFASTGTTINNQYNNLIPSITLSKGFGNQTLKVSYTQRITRPLIWYLNPWVNRSDPKNVMTGTPNLNPEINHAVELSHNLSTKGGFVLNTALYYRRTNNAIEYISRADTGGSTLSRPLNIAQREIVGLNLNANAKPAKNWNLSGGADLRHLTISSPSLAQQNKGWVWNANTNTTYKLPKDLSLQGYASVYSGWLSLQRRGTSFGYWYGLSAKKAFWNAKGSLTLSTNNPFTRGIRQSMIEEAPSYAARSESLFVNRSFRLTFEWRFGQMNAESGKQGKKIANDDSGR